MDEQIELADELETIRNGVDVFNPDAGSAARSVFEAAESVWKMVPKIISDLRRIAELEEALRFYRDEWKKAEHPFGLAGPPMTITHRLACDYGDRARAALAPKARHD